MRRPSLTAYLTVWALIRTWSLASGLGALPYPNAAFLFSDVRLYDWWASHIAVGEFPVGDEAWQYPPLAAVVFLAGYLIAPDTLGFLSLALIADVTLTMILFHAGRNARRVTELPVQLWLISPLLIGPIAQGRFDVFPTLAVAAGLLAARTDLRGAWFSVGVLLKVWPVLGVLATPRRELPRTIAAFVAVGLAVYIPLHAWWPQGLSFTREQGARGLQIEAVAALPYALWNLGPGTVTDAYQYGAMEVVAPGTRVITVVLSLATAAALAALAMLRLVGRLERAAPADVMLAAVLTVMCTSRVLSPQYNLWLIGLIAVCAVDPGPHFLTITRLILVTSLCGHALYPWLYIPYQEGAAVPVLIQTVRIATLVAATIFAWSAMLRGRPNPTADRVPAAL